MVLVALLLKYRDIGRLTSEELKSKRFILVQDIRYDTIYLWFIERKMVAFEIFRYVGHTMCGMFVFSCTVVLLYIIL